MVSDQEIPAVPVEEEAPLNFSELTPHQFGISTESFIPTSSTRKDKSRLAQIKARRRSSVGVRGSPETNSLIRFRAQQRMKTPPSSHSLELVMSSPFTLRQKMASFRSLMDVEESDACDPLPVQNDTGGCIFTQDYLSGKENNPPTSPASGKKRRLGPLKGCSLEIREGDISVCHSGLGDQEEAPCKHQSPDRPPSDGPSAASPAQQSHLSHIPSLPSALEMKPTVDVDRTPAGKKKKQVRFGVPLSPEFFDKNLPPSTPLQKGGTPARAATPGGGLELRSVLKTPQRSESETQQNQPEPLCPAGFGASPTFAVPHKRRPSHEGDDWEDGKIVYPSMEEIDSAVLSDAECYFDAQPLNLNMAFHEESLSQTLNGDSEPTGTSQMDAMEGRECVAEDKPPEGDAGSQTLTQSKSRRRKKKEEDSDSELRSRPDSRKRKANCLFAEQLEESEPVKRSARSAAKAACRKMKGASTAARSWSKDVDRSLYGSRAYASKNPTLSPITERRSFIGPSPSSERTPDGSTGSDIFEVASGALKGVDFAEAVEVSSYDDVRPPTCSPGTDSRQPRSADRRGRKKKEQIDVGLCRADPEEPSEILCTDSNTYNVGLLTLDEESITESEQRQGKQRRRSTVPLEPEHKEEGTGNEEMEQGDARSSSDQQGEVEGPNVDLAPWQADFNFEDVFKSVNPRRERSVRRSLRNRANSENSSVGGGLAWVPHTSPDSVRETRRRTRQRRLSAALLPPEETRDSASTELSEQ